MVLGVPLLDDSTDNKFLWACAGPQNFKMSYSQGDNRLAGL